MNKKPPDGNKINFISKVESKIHPDKPNDYFRCIKTSLKHVIKHDEHIQKITETAIKSNKIIIHTLQYIKLYSIHYYDINQSLPTIDKTFINTCMKIVCKEKTTGRPPSKKVKELKDELKLFYDKYYKN